MTIKVYISGICGSQEIRKLQQRVLFILESLPIDLEVIDVTDPGREEDLTFMQETAKKHGKKTQLPPQIFKDGDYCGDYDDFELANDDDDIMKFLKLESGPLKAERLKSGETITQNGIGNHEADKEITETQELLNTAEGDETNNSNVLMDSEENVEEKIDEPVVEESIPAENEAAPDEGEKEVVPEEKKENVSSEEESEEEESE